MRTDPPRTRRSLTLVAVACMQVSVAFAQVTRVEIVSREPANSGQPVGPAGPYEILRGRIHGVVDPTDAHNDAAQGDIVLNPSSLRVHACATG